MANVRAQLAGITPIFREGIAAATSALAEITFDLPLLALNQVYKIHRIIHTLETSLTFTVPAAADADIDETARAVYAISLTQGLAAVPDNYREDSCFWYKVLETQVMKAAAASLDTFQNRSGMPDVYVPPGGILVADNRISLYQILTGDNTPVVGTSNLEILVESVVVDSNTLQAIARAGDGFI